MNKSFQMLRENISSCNATDHHLCYYNSKFNPNKQNQIVNPVLTTSLEKQKTIVWLQLFLCLQLHSPLTNFLFVQYSKKEKVKSRTKTHICL